MKPVTDSPETIAQVCGLTGADEGYVMSTLREARHIIDSSVTDDESFIAPPLLIRRLGDPVFDRLRERLRDPDWSPIAGIQDAEFETVARELDLDLVTVEDFPMRGEAHLVSELVRRLDVEAKDGQLVLDIVYAWLDTFAPGQGGANYMLSRVGRESAFDAWLADSMRALQPFGYELEVYVDADSERGGMQWRFANQLRCDFLCRATNDSAICRRGDWIVIENKAVMAHTPALSQLAEYVELVKQAPGLVGDGEKVHGLLLSDGVTVMCQEALAASPFGYVSLSALGYREYLYKHHVDTGEAEPDTVLATHVLTESLAGAQDRMGRAT